MPIREANIAEASSTVNHKPGIGLTACGNSKECNQFAPSHKLAQCSTDQAYDLVRLKHQITSSKFQTNTKHQ